MTESDAEAFGDFQPPVVEYSYLLGIRPEDGEVIHLSRVGNVDGLTAHVEAIGVGEDDRVVVAVHSPYNQPLDLGGGEIASVTQPQLFVGEYQLTAEPGLAYGWSRMFGGPAGASPVASHGGVTVLPDRKAIVGARVGPAGLDLPDISIPASPGWRGLVFEVGFDD